MTEAHGLLNGVKNLIDNGLNIPVNMVDKQKCVTIIVKLHKAYSNERNDTGGKLIGFNMGLYNYLKNYSKRLTLTSAYSQIMPKNNWTDIFPEQNPICLTAATSLLKKAEESYSEFQALSTRYSDADRVKERESKSETWKSFKSIAGIGADAKYAKMTTDQDIPPSLYFFMLVYAFALLYFELKFSEQCERMERMRKNIPRASREKLYDIDLLPTQITEEDSIKTSSAFIPSIQDIWKQVQINLKYDYPDTATRLQTFIDNQIRGAFQKFEQKYSDILSELETQKSLPEQAHQEPLPEHQEQELDRDDSDGKPLLLSTGGASRRRTRHHHQHRRKSVRRNKKSRKGRKAIKMHRTKHRVHRRKLNKSKTKQRK
jgi:hypothetical protein